ncbi:MAG: hypothetical protein MK110_05940 [Fuerstiella sp.]|nr:hypothetical protein [Fuerstiella sp.]
MAISLPGVAGGRHFPLSSFDMQDHFAIAENTNGADEFVHYKRHRFCLRNLMIGLSEVT